MSDKTCKNCYHWCNDRNAWYGVGQVVFRVCVHPNAHDAGNMPDGMNSGPVFPQDGFSVYTGPDFGCIHWEPKP